MKVAYTAMASVRQVDQARAQATNMLANVSTVGFKESYRHATASVKVASVAFSTTYQPVAASKDVISLKAGPMQSTGRKLDVFMQAQTVLGVQASNEQIAFTRRGDLRVNEIGQLELGPGQLVVDDAGSPISVPLGQELEIGADGTIIAYDPELPEAPGAEVGRLMLRDASTTVLVRRLDGLFEPANQAGSGGDFESGPTPPEILTGALEGSSVNVSEMLTQLLDYNRSFESRIRLIKEVRDLDQAGSSMIKMA